MSARVAMGRRLARMAGLAFAVAMGGTLLTGCASDKPEPARLEALPDAALALRPQWTAALPGSVPFPMRTTVLRDALVLASDDGSVVGLELDTGRELWRASAGSRLTAGAGSDGRFAAVVTADNVLVTFDKGREIWRQALPARVATAPLVAGERVFVQGLDRAVLAFDAVDGRRLWTYQRAGEPLALNQSGVLQPVADTLWVGSGSRLVALDPLNGAPRHEIVIGNPRGSNEVERLADLIGPAARDGSVLCVRAFQTAVGCARAVSPALIWSRPLSGSQAVALSADHVIAADANDRLTAWWRGSGEVAWRSDKLLYRGLASPVAIGGSRVAFGDAEGYIHVLSASDGRTLLRLSTDGSGFAAPLVASPDGLLIAVSRSGRVHAFRIPAQ